MFYVDIVEYMELTREIRRAHLVLDEACIEIGGRSREFRGLLAHFLKTTLPPRSIGVLCHACHNERCSNVKHLYWGTFKDNDLDRIENGFKWKHPPCSVSAKAKIGSAVSKALVGVPKTEVHKAKIRLTLKNRMLDQDNLAKQREHMRKARLCRWSGSV